MTLDISAIVRLTVEAIPEVRPHLKGRALAFVFDIDTAYKTQEFFNHTLAHMVKQVYNGHMHKEFYDIMAHLVKGQLTDAYVQAWEDDGGVLPLPEYLASSLNYDVAAQLEFIDGFYKDIVATQKEKKPVDPLVRRASIWANQWKNCFNRAVSLVAENEGGKLAWELGETEQHCPFCRALNGIVAYASEWNKLDVHPQNAPNPALTGEVDGEKGCQGWVCDCKLKPTDKRRSPNAYQRIQKAIAK